MGCDLPRVTGLLVGITQGFMQDNILVSHTFFGGHVDDNSYTYQAIYVYYDLKYTNTPIFKV